MSASIAEIFEQITNIELLIKENRSSGNDTSRLEEQLVELKEKFQLMNETLRNRRSILEG